MDAHSLAGLIPRLTSLKIGNNSRHLDVAAVLIGSSSTTATSSHTQGDVLGAGGASATPAAGRAHANSSAAFPELQALDISCVYLLRPEVLGAFTTLTWLDLQHSHVPDAGDLLAVLPNLHELRYLNLKACRSTAGPPATVAALRAALSPLTQLTALDIGSNTYSLGASGLNAAAAGLGVQQAVTAGCLFDGLRLPRLLQLDADDMSCVNRSPFWGGGDLTGLVAAFPAVRELRIGHSLQLTADGIELQPLLALAGSLTHLYLNALLEVRDQHLQSLAELRGLSCLLVLSVGPHITDRGIVALSTLTGLTLLQLAGVTSDGVSTEVLPFRHGEGRRLFGDQLHLKTTVKVRSSICPWLHVAGLPQQLTGLRTG
jgi:hypothetical protein